MSWTPLTVTWKKPQAHKDLRKLAPAVADRIITAIDRYAEAGLGDVKRLVNVIPIQYRLRVATGRVRFLLDQETGGVVVLRVLPRGEAYRD